MRFDPSFDVCLWASADRHHRSWVTEKQVNGSKARVRASGRAPVNASNHTLLVIGIVQSLQTITKQQVAKRSSHKPKLKIITVDQTFSDALNALLARDKVKATATPMRSGRNLIVPLAHQLARFDVTLVQEKPEALLWMRHWSRRLDPVDDNAVAAFQAAFPAFAVSAHDFTAPRD